MQLVSKISMVWQNVRVKDLFEGEFVDVQYCPDLYIWSQTLYWEREICVCFFFFLLVKFLRIIIYGHRSNDKPHIFLVFSLVRVCVYFFFPIFVSYYLFWKSFWNPYSAFNFVRKCFLKAISYIKLVIRLPLWQQIDINFSTFTTNWY